MRYLLPNYERGDRYLRQICRRAHRFTHAFRLCNDPTAKGNKLTYGYLGNIARQSRLCQADSEARPLNNVLIADHGFGPQELRNNIYRLTLQNQHIRSVQFSTGRLLTHRHKNAIHQHLKTLQHSEHLQLTGHHFSNTNGNNNEIALFVEPAPVLTALQIREVFKPDLYAKSFKQKAEYAGLQLFRSHKRLEISLTQDGERQKTINNSEKTSIKPSRIKLAACPTSMIAVSLILQGIPVELSPIHPLADQLGLHIPALQTNESLDLIYQTIIKTTFSMDKIRSLEHAASEFKPEDDIRSDSIILKDN